jgi:hypothetical protein
VFYNLGSKSLIFTLFWMSHAKYFLWFICFVLVKLFGLCRLPFIQLVLQFGHSMLLFSTREMYLLFALVISCGGEPSNAVSHHQKLSHRPRCGKERNFHVNYWFAFAVCHNRRRGHTCHFSWKIETVLLVKFSNFSCTEMVITKLK